MFDDFVCLEKMYNLVIFTENQTVVQGLFGFHSDPKNILL